MTRRNGRKSGGILMQAGFNAFIRSRNTAFAALAVTLTVATGWLAVALAGNSGGRASAIGLGLLTFAAAVSLGTTLWLWRNPVTRQVQMMTTPALRQTLATHHAGHAVAVHIQDPSRLSRIDLAQPCTAHKAGISPAVTQTDMRLLMTATLAGLTAEEIFAGESGTHSSADLAAATSIGADMVGRLGMSGSLVSLAAARRRGSNFVDLVLEDPRTRKELEALLRDVKHETVRTMLENRHSIIAIRDALVRRGKLSARQIKEIIAGAEDVRHTDDEVLVDLRVVGGRAASDA